ncbi:MAG: AAA family ATPase [Microbacteriaceae bacterium]|nr:AAA family ATPase [Microbacteriaceae bacterium]
MTEAMMLRALDHAERGWYVFPATPNPVTGKLGPESFPKGWPQLATRDPETIATWFSLDYPDAQPAIAPDRSGCVILDVDQHPDKPNGFTSLAAAGIAFGPDVPFTISRSGNGVHWWHRGSYPLLDGVLPGVDRLGRGKCSVEVNPVPHVNQVTAKLPPLLTGGKVDLDSLSSGEAATPATAKLGPGETFADLIARARTCGNSDLLGVVRLWWNLAADGQPNATEALDAIRAAWLSRSHASGDPRDEFKRALDKVLRRDDAEQPAIVDLHASEVRKAVEKLRVAAEARALLAAEDAAAHAEDDEVFDAVDLAEMPTLEWWVEGVLPKGAVMLLAGPGNTGKTVTAVDLCLHIAAGRDWLGRFPTRQGRVLYAVGEGRSGYRARLDAATDRMGVDLPRGRFALQTAGVNLRDPASVARLKARVAADGIDVVVLDTQSTLAPVASENDNAEASDVLRTCREIAASTPGGSVVLVKHTDKANGTVRGAGAWRDDADMVWTLKGDRDMFAMSSYPSDGGKAKDAAPMKLHGLRVAPHLDSVVLERVVWQPPAGPDAADQLAEDMALAVALDPPPTSQNDAERRLGLTRARARAAYIEWVRQGAPRRSDGAPTAQG